MTNCVNWTQKASLIKIRRDLAHNQACPPERLPKHRSGGLHHPKSRPNCRYKQALANQRK